MLPSSLLLLLASTLLPSSLVQAAAPRTGCVPTGDETEINRLLDWGGRGTKVALCPNALFRLQNPILFTAEDQVLYTEGHPAGPQRAMLLVEGQNQSMAIKGDCTSCSGVTVQDLIIDGNRPLLLRMPMGEALVELGNANDQKVENCKLYEPRGWSALHFREGDWKSCSRATVRNNEIGPCGEEWDVNYDGTVEMSPLWGNPRSDGISLACMDSVVEDNTVYDTTDGAIVIFGSPGSKVRNNIVYSKTRTVLGGINLVDVPPWEGDYTDVVVSGNHISAYSAYLKVALNIGPAVWSDDTESIVSHGTVTRNTVAGTHFGYGIVVASCKNFTVVDNEIDEGSKFSGVMSEDRCPSFPKNKAPTAWVINKGSSEGVFQEEFVNGEVQHIICIEPVAGPGEDGLPRRLRDSPAAVAAQQAAALAATGHDPLRAVAELDADLTEAIVDYQMSLLNEVKGVGRRVLEIATEKPRRGEKKKKGAAEKNPFTATLMDLSTRLANLESDRKSLRGTFDNIKGDLKGLNHKFEGIETGHSSTLNRLLAGARKISSRNGDDPHQAHRLGTPSTTKSDRAQSSDEEESEGGHSFFAYFVALQATLVLGNWVYLKVVRYRRAHRKANGAGRKRSLSGGGLRMY